MWFCFFTKGLFASFLPEGSLLLHPFLHSPSQQQQQHEQAARVLSSGSVVLWLSPAPALCVPPHALLPEELQQLCHKDPSPLRHLSIPQPWFVTCSSAESLGPCKRKCLMPLAVSAASLAGLWGRVPNPLKCKEKSLDSLSFSHSIHSC